MSRNSLVTSFPALLLKERLIRNGFTLPVVCYCNGSQVTGCMKDLFTLGDCPVSPTPGAKLRPARFARSVVLTEISARKKLDESDACINPKRGDDLTYTASAFFQPCQGEAYTFANDHAANSWGECQCKLKSPAL